MVETLMWLIGKVVAFPRTGHDAASARSATNAIAKPHASFRNRTSRCLPLKFGHPSSGVVVTKCGINSRCDKLSHYQLELKRLRNRGY